jgi:type II secretory pathway pseudopilin PulG
LIELVVVIALIAIISVIALPSISSYFQVSIESATRQMASTFKEAYNASSLTGNVYRLAYDLKAGEYWVESGPPETLLDTKESLEKAESHRRFGIKDDEKAKSAFTMDKTVTRKRISLPRGVQFEDVITQQSKEPLTAPTTLMAYTHVFPQGLAEQCIVHLVDSSKHHVSLVFTAIGGRTDLYERYMKPEEAFGKPQ